MVKFVKKPVEIEAMPFDGANGAHFAEWLGQVDIDEEGRLGIPTLEGYMKASPGDWIIKGVKGEFYPCKPDIFELTYGPVSDAGTPLTGDPLLGYATTKQLLEEVESRIKLDYFNGGGGLGYTVMLGRP